MDEHGHMTPLKNGRLPAGHGNEVVRDAIANAITKFPVELLRALIWNEGAGMA